MIGYRTVAAAAIFVAGMAAGAPAQAQMVTASPESIAAILRGEGLKVETTTDSEGDPLLRSSLGDNRAFSVYFYGCTNHLKCNSAQYYAGYKDSKADFQKINDWNRKHRFGRAYIDTDGQPAIEMDIDLEAGGMSRGLFLDNFAFWKTLMDAFPDFIYAE